MTPQELSDRATEHAMHGPAVEARPELYTQSRVPGGHPNSPAVDVGRPSAAGVTARRWGLTDKGMAAVGGRPAPVVTDLVLVPVPTKDGLRQIARQNRWLPDRWTR